MPKLKITLGGWHDFRHSITTRMRRNGVHPKVISGTGIAVQQKLMRHTDIRTTMKYGDVVTDEMEQAHKKVVGLAMNGLQSGLQQP